MKVKAAAPCAAATGMPPGIGDEVRLSQFRGMAAGSRVAEMFAGLPAARTGGQRALAFPWAIGLLSLRRTRRLSLSRQRGDVHQRALGDLVADGVGAHGLRLGFQQALEHAADARARP